MKKTVKNQRPGDIRKQSPKKSVKKATKSEIMKQVAKKKGMKVTELPLLKVKIDDCLFDLGDTKPTYTSELEQEVVRLAKRVAELESTTLKVGQQVRYNEPKEPETFEDCVAVFKQGYENECTIHGKFMVQTTGDMLANMKLLAGAAVPSEKRAKQLAAIAKMMTVADALNGDWDFEPTSVFGDEKGVAIAWGGYEEIIITRGSSSSRVQFKDRETAEKAIKILGEDTIKTAFGL